MPAIATVVLQKAKELVSINSVLQCSESCIEFATNCNPTGAFDGMERKLCLKFGETNLLRQVSIKSPEGDWEFTWPRAARGKYAEALMAAVEERVIEAEVLRLKWAMSEGLQSEINAVKELLILSNGKVLPFSEEATELYNAVAKSYYTEPPPKKEGIYDTSSDASAMAHLFTISEGQVIPSQQGEEIQRVLKRKLRHFI